MDNGVVEFVDKLKQGAVDRCRERVLRAAEKTKYNNQKKTEHYAQDRGIAAHIKARRGL
ncbi:MAG TPA: hypothetical protein VEF35_07085 [Candidatus Bathyarchaeia archaeon]|nr:hypothetical protein [Candidatus Bathyarchaeia archaeon]